MPANSKVLALALGGGASKKRDEEEALEADELEPLPGMGGGLQTAAEELLAAIDAKDSSGVESALRAAFDILSSGEE